MSSTSDDDSSSELDSSEELSFFGVITSIFRWLFNAYVLGNTTNLCTSSVALAPFVPVFAVCFAWLKKSLIDTCYDTIDSLQK